MDQVEFLQDGNTRFSGFKFLIDGQMPTAFCHEPHNGTSWNTSTWDPETFKQAVRTLHDTGLQICVHCVGDAAVDLALDAFEAAMNANPRPDPRHRLEHAVLTTPEVHPADQGPRRRGQRQPACLSSSAGMRTVSMFGAEQNRRAMVPREWLETGILMSHRLGRAHHPWPTRRQSLPGRCCARPSLRKCSARSNS